MSLRDRSSSASTSMPVDRLGALRGSLGAALSKARSSDMASTLDIHKSRTKIIKRVKPWEDRSRAHATIGGRIRAKLPTVDSYDQRLEYLCDASPRVLLRLERVFGSDRVRITDPRYMTSLSKKIEDEERRIWKRRVQRRQNEEKHRYRQLIIDGILDPENDMKELEGHPIFRVNRLMKRINNLTYEVADTRIPAPIYPQEPFDELKETGYLFGGHSNHYLKVERPLPQPSGLALLPPTESYRPDSGIAPESVSKSVTQLPRISVDMMKRNSGKRVSMLVESIRSASSARAESLPAVGETLADLLKKQSLRQARRYLGLGKEELEMNFGATPKAFSGDVIEASTEDSHGMFEFSNAVVNVYKRENMKVDDFCSKTHRKLFIS